MIELHHVKLLRRLAEVKCKVLQWRWLLLYRLLLIVKEQEVVIVIGLALCCRCSSNQIYQ
jgi:hypothetical protein